MCKYSLILLALVFQLFSNAKAETITILADEWCPYNCVPDSDKPGFGIEIAKYAFEKAGHKIQYKTMSWSRAIETARAGNADAIIGAFKDDAPDFIFPEAPFSVSRNDFFVKSDSSWVFNGLKSLDKVSVGVIEDYSYTPEMDDYIKKHSRSFEKIQSVGGEDALIKNIRKLASGRVDVLLEDDSVMNYRLHEMGDPFLSSIKMAGSLSSNGLYIAFSPARPESKNYAKILDDGFNELKSSGKLKEILNKYGQ